MTMFRPGVRPAVRASFLMQVERAAARDEARAAKLGELGRRPAAAADSASVPLRGDVLRP